MKKYGFGVDIGGTTCKIGLFEMNGTLIEDWEIKTNTENKGASILDDVAVAIEGKMQSAGIQKRKSRASEWVFRDRLPVTAQYYSVSISAGVNSMLQRY